MRGFMMGRHGSDQLNLAILLLGIVLWVLSAALRFAPLYYIELVLYGYALFRMFSRNNAKRNAENMAFLNAWYKSTTEVKQFFNRLKNSKKYKYFRCPECKTRIRLPRKVGEVTVTCSKCGNKFKKKA